MENVTLILIVITNVLLVLVLGALVFLAWRYLKQKENGGNPTETPSSYHPAVLERMKEAEKLRTRRIGLFCPNHPEEPGETNCAICDRIYCRACIRPFKSLHFCKEHLPLIMRHDWDEVLTIKTSTTDPEHGVRLYERKKQLFEKEDVPTYVETHYKINVDQDFIETYLVVYGIREQVDEIRTKFAEI